MRFGLLHAHAFVMFSHEELPMKPSAKMAGTMLAFLYLGGTTPWVNANALHFSGNGERVTAPLPPLFDDIGNNNLTIAGRIRHDGSTGSGRVLFAQKDGNNFVSLLTNNNGYLYWYVQANGTSQSRNTNTSATGEWINFVARWDASASLVSLMVNGVTATFPGGNSSGSSNGTFILGSKNDGSQPLHGAIDELTIWPVWLSDSEAHSISNGICMEIATSQLPILHYDFDVGTAGGDNSGLDSLPDISGFEYHGTLLGFTLQGGTSNWIQSPMPSCLGASVFSDDFEGIE